MSISYQHTYMPAFCTLPFFSRSQYLIVRSADPVTARVCPINRQEYTFVGGGGEGGGGIVIDQEREWVMILYNKRLSDHRQVEMVWRVEKC